jgi:RNA polymerase sigma-70 factor (ECF subfamily)
MTTPPVPVEHLTNAAADMPIDERGLLSRVAAGDRSAFESLYLRYYLRLACFLVRSMGRSDGVGEMINDTFLEIWSGVHHLQPISPDFSTCVFGIAYRKARARQDQQRKIGVAPETELDGGLLRGLTALSFEQRTTLILAYQEGCAMEEIATITGVPIASVKARMLSATLRF